MKRRLSDELETNTSRASNSSEDDEEDSHDEEEHKHNYSRVKKYGLGTYGSSRKKQNAWVDIFAASKLILRADPNDAGKNLVILHADDTFEDNFKFMISREDEQLLSFDELMGDASSPTVSYKIKDAMYGRSNHSCTEYINLYTRSGAPLSCHIHFQPLTRNYGENARVLPEGEVAYLWGVLTIRSASVVGNAKCFGIGFFPLNQLGDDAKVDALSVVTAQAQAKKEKPATETGKRNE